MRVFEWFRRGYMSLFSEFQRIGLITALLLFTVQVFAAPQGVQGGNQKRLERDFLKRQRIEFLKIQNQHRQELKVFKTIQAQQVKDWEKKEREDRHKFFQTNLKGPERRNFIHDFQDRRKILFKVQKDDLAQKKADQRTKEIALQQEHQAKLKEFRDFLSRGEPIPEFLWPPVAQ